MFTSFVCRTFLNCQLWTNRFQRLPWLVSHNFSAFSLVHCKTFVRLLYLRDSNLIIGQWATSRHKTNTRDLINHFTTRNSLLAILIKTDQYTCRKSIRFFLNCDLLSPRLIAVSSWSGFLWPPHHAGEIWKRSFVAPFGPTFHTDPWQERSFKQEKF